MATAPKYSPYYTLADYQQWQGDWELWQGVAVAMTPSPFGRHQYTAGQISRQFLNSLDSDCDDCFVLSETDWIVAEDTVVRPDVVIVCGGFPERHIMHPPRLIVEVLSPATEDKDRVAKRHLYASQAVRFYMLVDPIRKSVEPLRWDAASRNYVALPIHESLTFELKEGCVARLDLKNLFH